MIKRKSSVSFFIFLLFHASLSFSQQNQADLSLFERTPVFKELFDNNSNNWITDNQYVNGRLENGQYVLKCKNYKGSTGLSYKTVKLDLSRDYEIEASLQIIKGSGGLLFGMNDKYDHYRIEINDKNNLFVVKNTPSKSKNEILLNSADSPVIKTNSVNKITIRKLNDTFYIFVNESLIKEFRNIKPEGKQVGFNAGKDSEVSVDYLIVSYLVEKTKPTVADISQSDKVIPSDALKIEWISPTGLKTSIESFSATVRTRIKSESGIKDVLFYVNGVASKGESEIRSLPGDSGVFLVEKTISFTPGENSVYVIATNNEGSEKSDIRYFIIPSATTPEIRWITPLPKVALINKESIKIEVCIQSPTKLKSIEVLVNGIPQSDARTFQAPEKGDCNYRWQGPVVLKEGDNEIFVIAKNLAGSTTSENRVVKRSSSFTERRLALVFGNSQYGTKISLKNPVNDANLMEGTLKALNFDVIKRIDAGKSEMEQAVMEFNRKLPDYNVALFYYAGHGIQVDGVNYLIPTDAKLEQKVDCQWEAVSVTDIIKQFEKYPDNINVVILDACRNNPFTNWVRGNEAGFKFLPNVSGTIIGYATVEGATAADGAGFNGLYTEELVKQMVIPQPIESVFKRTRVQVELRSNGLQSPQETTGLRGDFYFIK